MATAMTKQEQLDKYLEAREALKEKFRLQYRREAAAAEQPKKSNFSGYSSSFFGPSAPSAAPRLLRNFFGGAPSANAAGDNNKKREQQQAPLQKKREFIKSPAPPSAGSRTKKSVPESSRNPNQVVNPKSREIPNPEKNRAAAVVRKPNPNPEKKRVPVVDSNRKFKVGNPNPRETPKSFGSNQKLTTRSRDDPDYVLWKRRRIEEEEEEREAEKAFSEIRKMFNTSRFIGRDDRDFGAMESSFEQIGKEERRSAKLAREEDAEELRLIALEEQREKERKRRLAATAAPGKKRKFQDSDSDSESE